MNKEERLQLEEELLMTCSKAQMINKYIDELAENSKLSELWCKSQQENQQLKDRIKELENVIITNEWHFANPQVLSFKVAILKDRINKAIEYINNTGDLIEDCYYKFKKLEQVEQLLEILKGDSNE